MSVLAKPRRPRGSSHDYLNRRGRPPRSVSVLAQLPAQVAPVDMAADAHQQNLKTSPTPLTQHPSRDTLRDMATSAHRHNLGVPQTPLTEHIHDCKSCQYSLDGFAGIMESKSSAPDPELRTHRTSHNFPDSDQILAHYPKPAQWTDASAEYHKKQHQSSRIADTCSKVPTDGLIHPGQGDEGSGRIKGHIAGPYDQKSSHAAGVKLDPAAEASLMKMERGQYTSTSGQWPSRSGQERDALTAGRLSKRRGLVLLALEAAGSVLMTQWRWSRPGNLSMGHCKDLSRGATPSTTAWGSGPEDTTLLDHPGVLLLGIVSSFASLAFHYHQTQVENQDLVLIATVGSTVLMSSLSGLDASTILLRVAPWAAMLGFWVNTYRGSGQKSSVR